MPLFFSRARRARARANAATLARWENKRVKRGAREPESAERKYFSLASPILVVHTRARARNPSRPLVRARRVLCLASETAPKVASASAYAHAREGNQSSERAAHIAGETRASEHADVLASSSRARARDTTQHNTTASWELSSSRASSHNCPLAGRLGRSGARTHTHTHKKQDQIEVWPDQRARGSLVSRECAHLRHSSCAHKHTHTLNECAPSAPWLLARACDLRAGSCASELGGRGHVYDMERYRTSYSADVWPQPECECVCCAAHVTVRP